MSHEFVYECPLCRREHVINSANTVRAKNFLNEDIKLISCEHCGNIFHPNNNTIRPKIETDQNIKQEDDSPLAKAAGEAIIRACESKDSKGICDTDYTKLLQKLNSIEIEYNALILKNIELEEKLKTFQAYNKRLNENLKKAENDSKKHIDLIEKIRENIMRFK